MQGLKLDKVFVERGVSGHRPRYGRQEGHGKPGGRAESARRLDGFREERDRAQARADHAEAARDRAEQGRDAGRAGADALARKAHAEVETLRRGAGDADRKARGLVARLRAAWRGE
jgi:hypothetical protein